MIAVDTNILVRYVTNDDPVQARKAMALLGGASTIVVSPTVLLELEWVLRGAYDLPRGNIQRAMLQILGLPNVRVEQADRIRKAMSWFAQGMDFADALHLAFTPHAERFATFDRRFARSAVEQGLAVELL